MTNGAPASTNYGNNPMWVTCNRCQHRWIGLYLPMPISDAAKVMGRLTCPKCANSKILVHDGSAKTEVPA